MCSYFGKQPPCLLVGAEADDLQGVAFCRSVVVDPDMGPAPELVNVGLFEYRPTVQVNVGLFEYRPTGSLVFVRLSGLKPPTYGVLVFVGRWS